MHTQSNVRLSAVEWLALVLAIVGALNWGLVGLGGFVEANLNVVNLLLGAVPVLENIVYLIVGLAGIFLIYLAYELYASPTERQRAEAEPTR